MIISVRSTGVTETEHNNTLTYKVLTTSQPDYLHNLLSYRIVSYTCIEKTLAKDKPKIRNNSVIVNDGDNVSTGNTSLITSG